MPDEAMDPGVCPCCEHGLMVDVRGEPVAKECPQCGIPLRRSSPDDGPPGMAGYDQRAARYCKSAIVLWCIVGWAYAAAGWRLLWLPAVLVFFPGVFIAAAIAALFFIPLWFSTQRVRRDWEERRQKNWMLLMVATLLRIGVLLGPVVGAVGYVKALRMLLE